MLKKTLTLVVIIAIALPGLMAIMPATQGLPSFPDAGRNLLAEEEGAGAALSSPTELHLVVADFDPLVERVSLSPAFRTTTWDGLFLIQFIGPTMPHWVDRVEAMGCDLVSYIPDYGYIAVMSKDARRSVVDLPYVRWVGPYHAGYRVSPDLWLDSEPVLGLAVVAVDDPAGLAQAIVDRGGAVDSVGTKVVQGLLPRASLLSLAKFRGIEWVEAWLEPELHNDNSARLIGGRQLVDGPWQNTTKYLWSWNDVTETYEGITGDGYIVSAADTGLDDDHPNLAGHLPSVNYVGGDPNIDTYGHGTHVLGTAAGFGVPYPADAALGIGIYIGVAPEANVFSQDIFDGSAFFRNFDVIGKDASQRGAVVNSNSWGEYRGGQYTANELAYDTMVRDADPTKPGDQAISFTFSSGNSGGSGDRSVGSPASGKNIITVGATGNDKRGVSGQNVAGFSSRGPTADGRIKPDVVASGQNVVSSAAWPHSMPFDPPSDGGTSWTFASGTSMSCPAVAGAVALVHDYSTTIYEHPEPSPALVKALLINGADKLTSDATYPGTRAGWGRVNLTKLYETQDYRTFFYDQETPLRVGGKESQRYIFAMDPGERTFRFTLVWTDYPGSTAASKALVSDLDLVITDPNGNVFRGNNFDSRGYSEAGEDTSNDTVNNVEKVVIPQAKEGFYSVQVFARNTPNGAQDFALVGQGDLRNKWRDLVAENVTLNKEELDEGEPIIFAGDIVAMGNLLFSPFHYEIYLRDKETGTKTIFEEAIVTNMVAWESIHFSHRWFSVRGDWEFVVDVDTGNTNKEFSKLNNQASIGRFVKGYGLLAELLPSDVIVWPGLEAHLEVNVYNTGNVIDTFTMSTEGIPVGWTVELDQTDITLGREKTGTIMLRVMPPPAAKAGEVSDMNVRIASVGNSTYKSDLTSIATVGQVHGLRSDLADEGTSVLPGKSVVHVINVTNTGNGDDTYHFDVFGTPLGWKASFNEESVTIEDNVTKVVSLELESPAKAIHGTIADLDITISSSTGQSQTLSARTQVRHTTGMTATLWADESIMPGGRIKFYVEIDNLGNGFDDFFYSEQLPKGWTTTFPLKEVDLTLEAFESYNGSGELKCPSTARAGTYPFTIQIFTRESIEELTVNVQVEEVYDASIIPLSGVSAIYPGNESFMTLGITSLCNLPTEFATDLTNAPSDWTIVYDPRSATLDTLKAREFNITIGPPPTTPSGMYYLTIEITFGPITEYHNITLYVMELPSDVGADPSDDGGLLAASSWMIILVVIAVLAIVVISMRSRSGRSKAVELGFEDPKGTQQMSRPLPPPPPPETATRRPLPPPPPPKTPETVDELLAGTPAMERVSDTYDRYSSDVAYASGSTLATQGEPVYAGDCPKCGGKVLEYASGSLMCKSCGTQYTDR